MKKIYKITFGMVAALLIAACADDKEFAEFTKTPQSGRTVTVTASMPGDKSVSKIGLVQADNSLNMITKWQSADEVQIFVSQNGNSYAVGKSTVQNISDDGKSCSFSFDLPSEISAEAPYSVYGFCGIDGKLENGSITIDAAAKRIPLEKMKAPCYFVAQPTSANFEAKFNHIGTYEILHVANKSASDITFTHNGYTTSAPWYYNAMHGTLPCSTSIGTLTNTGADGEAVSESATIPAGTTASIVSWYMPTGSALSEAVLNAAINGNAVKSSDTKSSSVSIQNGKAYHLYVTWDGEKLRFGQKVEPEIPVTGDGYVDLGLPSGTLWATCNVGAQNPWDYGCYFAWGETEPKDDYSWSTYKYCNGSKTTMTKYCNESDYGYNGFTDELTVLQPEDDAATVNLGSNWRMPTEAEFQELYDNCDWEWTSNYNGTGVAGRIVKSRSNSNSLFLPAAGYRYGGLDNAGSNGDYWSSSLNTDYPDCGRDLDFNSGDVTPDGWRSRFCGQSVRAVRTTGNSSSVDNPPAFDLQLLVAVDGQPVKEVDFGELVVFSVKSSVSSNIRVYIDNKEIEVSNPNISADTYVDMHSTDELPVGTHTFKIVATDSNGNTVEQEEQFNVVAAYNPVSDHEYVDLGLPSGTLWATCNVGAQNPWDYVDYFAWGETEPKEDYSWSTYKYCNGSSSTMTKYCNKSDSGYNGFTDELTVLQPEDDAATVNLGSNWRMPTQTEFQELYDNCDWEWTGDYNGTGVAGRIVKSRSNSNSIFFPAAGDRDGTDLFHAGSGGNYWSSSLYTDIPYGGRGLRFYSGGVYPDDWQRRRCGQSVRAVRCRN